MHGNTMSDTNRNQSRLDTSVFINRGPLAPFFDTKRKDMVLPQPYTDEEQALAERYRQDINTLRTLRKKAGGYDEMVATLLVNYGPEGRQARGWITGNEAPMTMLITVLSRLSGIDPKTGEPLTEQ